MHFELVDLRLLLAIADAGSLSKAAQRFPIALSAASNRLRKFEQSCGVEIFARSADGMTPTAAGRFILERAARVASEVEQLKDTVRDLRGERRVTLRLAGTTVAISTFLPAAVGRFLADHPEVDLQLLERGSPDVLQAVRSGEVELGILDGNVAGDAVTSLPFRSDRLVLVVAQGHPLAERGAIRLRDALDHAFICLPAKRAMQRFIEAMASSSGRELKIRVRASSFDAIAQLVANQAGIAMLPEAAATRFAREMPVRIVALEDPWAIRELRVCFAELGTLTPHAERLLGYLGPNG